jgi:hypothetical protein
MQVHDTVKPAGVLSHVEAVYRPGDRQLAIDLFEALGCRTIETDTRSIAGGTYVSVHPDPMDRSFDNVIYLSEMPAQQHRLETVLAEAIASNEELRSSREHYRSLADDHPYSLCHIALRYPSFQVIDEVLAGIEDRLTPEMKARSTLKVLRPGDDDHVGFDSIQAFLYTDIAVSGISAFGQVFEMAAYRQ